ncbi:MAG TPA: hypothetical protein DCP90_01845 [Clostridiales bacterium]|nr:MAG: hypothetical protein A2Y22_03345 [Clostridiales bacterium GWD2_32_59]HAN09336.1 hypothetical protein [Clostridiales bacterium]
MKKRPGSYIVFYEGDKILLLHRPDGYTNEYSYIGGGIEKGETPDEAVVREVKEELCYDLKQGEYDLIGHKNFVFDKKGETWEVDAHMYVANLGDKLNKFVLTEKEYDTGKESKLELVSIKNAKMLNIHWTGLELLEMIEEYMKNFKAT